MAALRVTVWMWAPVRVRAPVVMRTAVGVRTSMCVWAFMRKWTSMRVGATVSIPGMSEVRMLEVLAVVLLVIALAVRDGALQICRPSAAFTMHLLAVLRRGGVLDMLGEILLGLVVRIQRRSNVVHVLHVRSAKEEAAGSQCRQERQGSEWQGGRNHHAQKRCDDQQGQARCRGTMLK